MPTVSKKKLLAGDEVNVRLGPTMWRARIIEDRGPVGFEGRQFVRVQLFNDDNSEPQSIDVPADYIEFLRR